jgi:hypothetical protein
LRTGTAAADSRSGEISDEASEIRERFEAITIARDFSTAARKLGAAAGEVAAAREVAAAGEVERVIVMATPARMQEPEAAPAGDE